MKKMKDNSASDSNMKLLKKLTSELNARDEELIESERRFRGFFENSTAGMCVANLKTGMFLEVNRALCEWLGYTKEELLSRKMVTFLAPETSKETENLLNSEESFKEEIIGFVNEYLHKDGSSVFLSWNASVPNSEGINYSAAANITKEVNQKKKIESQRKMLDLSLELSEQVFCLHKPNGELIWASPSVEKVFGYQVKEIIGKKPTEFIFDGGNKKIRVDFEDDDSLIKKFKKANGDSIWIEIMSKEITDENGSLKEIWTSSRDVTKKYRIKRKLEKSEERYKIIAEGSSELILIKNLDRKIIWTSPSSISVLGWNPKDLTERYINDFIHPEDLDLSIQISNEVLKTQSNITGEIRLKTRENTYMWFNKSVTPIFDKENKVKSILTKFYNINERKAKELKLELEIETLKKNSELDKVGTYEVSLNKEQNYLYASNSYLKMFGLNPDIKLKELSKSINKLIDEDVLEEINKIWQKTVNGEHEEFEYSYWITTAKNERKLFKETITLRLDYKNRPISIMGTAKDITEAHIAFNRTINQKH